MYVTDLRKDFFDVIKSHERVLVVANFDVDSVCAVKILQWLLKCDHVTYTLVPVRGKTDLIEAFKDNVGNSNDTDGGTTVKYVVMINCGGTFDIVDFFDPPEDVVIFVADSHRPTDVCNIYSDEQVRLLMKPDEDEGKLNNASCMISIVGRNYLTKTHFFFHYPTTFCHFRCTGI